jgi:preprotein translocase subunit SecG
MATLRSILIEGVTWLTLAIMAFSLTFKFDDHLANYRYGAASWPRAIITGIVIFTLIQVVLNILALVQHRSSGGISLNGEDAGTEKTPTGAKTYLKRVATFGVPLLFLFMIPRMGYYALAPLFIVGYMLLLGERKLIHLVVTSFMIYAVTLLVFTKLLFVPLPEGTWPGFYEFSSWIIVLLQ